LATPQRSHAIRRALSLAPLLYHILYSLFNLRNRSIQLTFFIFNHHIALLGPLHLLKEALMPPRNLFIWQFTAP